MFTCRPTQDIRLASSRLSYSFTLNGKGSQGISPAFMRVDFPAGPVYKDSCISNPLQRLRHRKENSPGSGPSTSCSPPSSCRSSALPSSCRFSPFTSGSWGSPTNASSPSGPASWWPPPAWSWPSSPPSGDGSRTGTGGRSWWSGPCSAAPSSPSPWGSSTTCGNSSSSGSSRGPRPGPFRPRSP